MSNVHTQLSPPLLLLATPQVQDPFFHQSVVLLVKHDDQGSMGLILNRPTGSCVAEVLQGMGIPWGGGGEVPVHFGGPVHPHLGTLLFDAAEAHDEAAAGGGMELPGLSGVRFTRDMADLEKLAGNPPRSFRLLLGSAGWGPGQLLEEILRNDWLIAPLSRELLFSPSPEGIWAAALHSVGIDPAALPAWMPESDDSPVA